MRYHNVTKADMLNGEGLRVVLWVSGCSHKCPGCQNAITWNPDDGVEFDDDTIKEIYHELDQDWCSGLTLSGGDPVCQSDACYEIAKAAHEMGLNVWCYSGFTFEKMLLNPKHRRLLDQIDVLVDGKYVEEERSLNLYFRGSRNQRIIDVQESLKEGRVVLIEKYIEEKSYSNIYEKPKYMFI